MTLAELIIRRNILIDVINIGTALSLLATCTILATGIYFFRKRGGIYEKNSIFNKKEKRILACVFIIAAAINIAPEYIQKTEYTKTEEKIEKMAENQDEYVVFVDDKETALTEEEAMQLKSETPGATIAIYEPYKAVFLYTKEKPDITGILYISSAILSLGLVIFAFTIGGKKKKTGPTLEVEISK